MAFKGAAHIEIEGLKEFQVALKACNNGKLPAEVGKFHKEIGAFIVGKVPDADPHAVGAGTGAFVRPSATKRDVVLRVGHGGREASKNQWGKTEVQPFRVGRPYIVGVIEENADEIADKFLESVVAAYTSAFHSAQ